MTQADEPRRESIPGLARRLIGGFVQLAKLEVTRGRQEIGEMVAETKVGAMFLGAAAALGLLALITLDVAIVLGVAALFEVVAPLAAAIIIVATFVAVAIGFAVAGAASAVAIIGLLIAAAIFAVPAYLGFTAGWFAALYVLAIQAALVALFAMRGIQRVRIGPPEETIDAVKEDIAWAKRLLKRG
jgi:Putative Actinobacterial Holin-X, holin superfamily III